MEKLVLVVLIAMIVLCAIVLIVHINVMRAYGLVSENIITPYNTHNKNDVQFGANLTELMNGHYDLINGQMVYTEYVNNDDKNLYISSMIGPQ